MHYFCHHCHRSFASEELLPEFTCPTCRSGFVEEMAERPAGPASARRSRNPRDPERSGSDEGLINFNRSSDEFSDDNSDAEFLESMGPLAQVFNLFHQANNEDTDEGSTTSAAQSSQQSDSNTQTQQTARRYITRRTVPTLPASIVDNQSLADVLHDFIAGASTFSQYPEGTNFSGPSAASGSGSASSANRGLINIDFPLPFFLHSNPGDYAWGNAGFDAVITQLLNNLDGSNSGPPPMPKDQVENLPTVKISDEQVKATNLQCTVCMDDFQVGDSARQLPCEHFFHQDCIIPWLNLHASCPICRKTFATGTNPTSQSLNTSDTPGEARPNESRTTDQTNTAASTTVNPTTNRNNPATATATTTTPARTNYDYTEDDCD